MAEKTVLLVCEGETDLYVFQELTKHFSTLETRLVLQELAPQQDATSGTYLAHGFGNVLNWCAANCNKIQMLIDFRGAEALFIQMDTDIATQIHPECTQQGHTARHCCQDKLNHRLAVFDEPDRCHYILPTQNTETWLLSCQDYSVLDKNLAVVSDYETITDIDQHLIDLGFKSKKGANKNAARKLDKRPANKYKKYGKQLVANLATARARCAELDRLSQLFDKLHNFKEGESVQ